MLRRFILLMSLLLLFVIAVSPVLAAAPKPAITVLTEWRPDSQLTSLDTNGAGYPNEDAGDDYRYVDFEVSAISNVQYWATEVTCSFDTSVLDYYDDVEWGPNYSGDFATKIATTMNGVFKVITITSAKYGYSYPLGGNGYDQSDLLLTFHFRTFPQTSPFEKAVAPVCSASFLDLDGKPVVPKPRMSPPAKLMVRSGYSIVGNITYQNGPKTNAGIGINCYQYDTAMVYPALTDLKGNFKITNLRDFGGYECHFWGNLINPNESPDLHLTASTWLNLWSDHLYLLPTTLRSGNVSRTGNIDSGNESIDDDDIAVVTGLTWPTAVTPYSSGDANGDGKVEKSDLAVVAGNYGNWEYTDAEHWISTFNSYTSVIYYGNPYSSRLTAFGKAGANRYWPALSPNGDSMAYVEEGKTGMFALKIEPTPAVGGKIIQLTPVKGWNFNAFAPSWSGDGTQIAFVCSYLDNWHFRNSSNICVVNADGTNLRIVAYNNAEIYPPTWWDNRLVLYGGDSYAGRTIYAADTSNGNGWAFDTDNIPDGSSQPSFINYNNGPALFYVYDDGSESRLRFADIDGNFVWDGSGAIAPFASIDTNPDYPYHMDVTWWDSDSSSYLPISTNLDYYEVAHNRQEVIFTEYYHDYNFDGGGWTFYPTYFDWDAEDPTWWQPNWWSYPGQNGNPYWDGDPYNWTDLFGLRNTINWTP